MLCLCMTMGGGGGALQYNLTGNDERPNIITVWTFSFDISPLHTWVFKDSGKA